MSRQLSSSRVTLKVSGGAKLAGLDHIVPFGANVWQRSNLVTSAVAAPLP